MNASERYHLVRELEEIKWRESKAGGRKGLFRIAFLTLVVSAELIVLTVQAAHDYSPWIAFGCALFLVAILTAGIYSMVRYMLDKKLTIVIKAILSEKEPEGSVSSNE